MYTHGLILDVKALSEKTPYDVAFGPESDVGLGTVANRLGPVLIVGADEEELEAWRSSAEGLEWIHELSNGNAVEYDWDVSEELYEVASREFGIGWGKTVVAIEEALIESAERLGMMVCNGLEELRFERDLLIEEEGIVGKDGPQSWSAVFDAPAEHVYLGETALLHDYHVMDGGDFRMILSGQGGGCYAMQNLVELLRSVRAHLPIRNLLISTHAKFSVRMNRHQAGLWLEWESNGWLSWDKRRPDVKRLHSDRETSFNVIVQAEGLREMRGNIESCLKAEGLDEVNVFMLALNAPNKDAGHRRFLLSEYAYATVDPGWRVFRGENQHVDWDCNLSSYCRRLPRNAKGMRRWSHWMGTVGRSIHATHAKNKLVLGVDSDGLTYEGMQRCFDMPFSLLEGVQLAVMNTTTEKEKNETDD